MENYIICKFCVVLHSFWADFALALQPVYHSNQAPVALKWCRWEKMELNSRQSRSRRNSSPIGGILVRKESEATAPRKIRKTDQDDRAGCVSICQCVITSKYKSIDHKQRAQVVAYIHDQHTSFPTMFPLIFKACACIHFLLCNSLPELNWICNDMYEMCAKTM